MTISVDLSGRTALVTGGGGHLGRAFAIALARNGARVAVADIEGEAAARTVADIGSAADAAAFTCDVSDPDAVDRVVEAAGDALGPIDILINNAATQTADLEAFFLPPETASYDIWREVISVNLDGMFLMAQAVGRRMIDRDVGGSIVQMSSIYGVSGPDPRIYDGATYKGGPMNLPIAYSASKAAIVGLTRHLATAWGKHGIRVNAVAPGGVERDPDPAFRDNYVARVPLGRMAQSRDVTGAVLYLASDAADYVTGQVLLVDGGWTTW